MEPPSEGTADSPHRHWERSTGRKVRLRRDRVVKASSGVGSTAASATTSMDGVTGSATAEGVSIGASDAGF